MTESLRPRQPPFRSLDFFTSADAAIFAGREEEIEEVATRILAGNTLVVYGPSGVGKTSLLCAGVVPALENRRGYRATYVRPLQSPRGDVWRAVGADPAEPLAAPLARLPALPPPGAAHLDTISVAAPPEFLATRVVDMSPVQGSTGCAPHVLVLDQLEELFTRFDESQRRPLWDGLVEVIEDPRAPVRLVLSLREEYLHFLDSAHPRLPNLLDRRFRLRGLAPFGARTAIVRPLVAGRIRYEPELVDRCVADLTEVLAGHSNEDGVVDPLLLQIVCSEVYRGAQQRDPELPSLTLADYTELGGPAGVFRRHLDELFNRVHAEDHLLLKLVLQEMTTAHATKLPTTISRLSQSGLLPSAAEIQELLDKLVAASLVRKYDAEQEPWYELVHDRLVQALPEHFARDQRFLRIRYMRELVRQLTKGFADGMLGAPLLNRQQLVDLVEPFRKYIRFSEEELGLLFRSAVAVEHNVVAWRDAYDAVAPGRAPAVLLEMLSHTDTRCGALASLGLLRVTEPTHRAYCLRLALSDNNPVVATAASKTLSVVAGTEEAAKIALALKGRSTRPRALWVLAELTERSAFQLQTPARALRMAKREHERRRLLPAWETIQRKAWEGLRIGVGTGALSGLGGIVFWCIAMMWLGHDDFATYAAGAAVIASVSMMLSATCGYVAGRATAKLQELDRNSTWVFAIQDRGVLEALGVLFILSAFGSALFLAVVANSLATTQSRAELNTTFAVIALWPLAPTVVLSSIWLTGRMLPRALWHRSRSSAIVAIRTFSFSWLLTIGIGDVLVSLSGELSPTVSVIMMLTLLFGTWCSICATSIAGVLAESIWKQSQSRQIPSPRWLGLIPVAVLIATIIILLRHAPPPFWAPTVDVTQSGQTQVGARWSHDLATSWTYGRWLQISNRSHDAHIVSLSPLSHSMDLNDLLLVWPGTHIQWFPSEVIKLYSFYRQIDLALDPLSACTYTVVQLENTSSSRSWTKRLDLGAQVDLLVRRLGCRAFLADGTIMYSDGYGSQTNGQLDRVSGSILHSEGYEGSVVNLTCGALFEHIQRLEAIVVFDTHGDRCP